MKKLKKLNYVIEKIKELPTLPVIANRVQEMLYDPKTNISDLANIIEKDQSIATKILKLVNSAFYSLPDHVTNISQAITLLGFKNISQIVMTLSVFDTLRSRDKGVFDRRQFWLHSIGTAIIGKRIALETGTKDPDDVFTSCLLHDIGKVFMDGFLKDEFKEIIKKADDEGISFYRAENELFDVNHSMIGEWIARAWNLPIHIIAAIKHHHEPFEDRNGLSFSKDISIDIVVLADIASRKSTVGNNGDGRGYKPKITNNMLKRLPISKDDIISYIGKVKQEIKEYEILLNMAV